jgi:hypothetical protein
MSNFHIISVVFLTCLGCVTVPSETPAGKAIKVVQSDVPADCKELGSVHWHGAKYHSLSDVKIALKEKAAALGGNVLRLESIGSAPEVNGVGTAYKCPTE